MLRVWILVGLVSSSAWAASLEVKLAGEKKSRPVTVARGVSWSQVQASSRFVEVGKLQHPTHGEITVHCHGAPLVCQGAAGGQILKMESEFNDDPCACGPNGDQACPEAKPGECDPPAPEPKSDEEVEVEKAE